MIIRYMPVRRCKGCGRLVPARLERCPYCRSEMMSQPLSGGATRVTQIP